MPDLRVVRPESLHVTLVFLGYQYERDVERIAELAFAAAAADRSSCRRRTCSPCRAARPRLFALGLARSGGDADAVAGRSSRSASHAARLYEPEKRPFWPHVTLARAKRGKIAARGRAAGAPAGAAPARSPPRVTLYRRRCARRARFTSLSPRVRKRPFTSVGSRGDESSCGERLFAGTCLCWHARLRWRSARRPAARRLPVRHRPRVQGRARASRPTTSPATTTSEVRGHAPRPAARTRPTRASCSACGARTSSTAAPRWTPPGRRRPAAPTCVLAVLDSGIKWNDAGADVGPAPQDLAEQRRAAAARRVHAARLQRRRRLQRRATTPATRASTSTDPRRVGPAGRDDAAGPDHRLLQRQRRRLATASSDDIAGWDFLDNDNDAYDDVQYGHGTGRGGGLDRRGEQRAQRRLLPELHVHAAARGRLVRRRREQLRAGGALRRRQRRARDPGGARHAQPDAARRARRSSTRTTTASR